MKKRILAAAAMLMGLSLCTTAFAAEEAGDTQTTIVQSEESATGYFVTFRYYAPDAERVRLKGNFSFTDYLNASLKTALNAAPSEWQDGYFNYGDDYYCDMELNEETGAWEVTLPLPNGTYSYNFYVGGNAEDAVDNVENAEKADDPAHPCLVTGYETSSDVGSSSIYVPRDAEKQPESQNLEIEAPREDHNGEIFFESLEFQEATIPFGVYLPDGYDSEREEAYPVLVMLHGGGGNEGNWFNDGLVNIVDNLTADYDLEETIVVTPNWSAVNSEKSSTAFEQLYDFLSNDLYPYITETYHGAEDSAHRALAGLSQGGARTMYMAYYHRDMCDYFFGYSCPWDTEPHGTPELNPEDYEGKTIFVGCGLYDFVKADCYLSEGSDRAETEQSIYKHVYTMSNAGVKFYSCFEPPYGHQWQTWRQLAAYSIGNLLWK